MPWIKSHSELLAHPKTKRAARSLGVSIIAMVGHLHALWWWAMEYAPDGLISAYDPEDIADAVMWDGNPEDFLNALLECGARCCPGFLERNENGDIVIHDWEEHCGKDYEKRQKDAEKMKRYRERRKNHGNDDIAVTGALPLRNGNVMGREGEGDRERERDTTPPISPPRGDEAVGEASPEPPEDGAVKVSEVVELWNTELCPLGFPKVSRVTPERRKHFKARLRDGVERRELAWWRDRIAAIAGSEFMRKSAAEKAQWLDFDWLLNETNLVKVAEGKYGRVLNLPRGQPTGQAGQSMDEYMRELQKDPFWGGSGGAET